MYWRAEQVAGHPIRNCSNKYRKMVVFFDPGVFNQTSSFQVFVASNSPTPSPMKWVPHGVLERNHTVSSLLQHDWDLERRTGIDGVWGRIWGTVILTWFARSETSNKLDITAQIRRKAVPVWKKEFIHISSHMKKYDIFVVFDSFGQPIREF